MVKEIKKCSIDHCDREVKSKGFCGRHYQSLWKYGDPLHVEKNGRTKEIKNKPLPYEETHKHIDNVECKLCRECNEWHPMNEDNFYPKKGLDGFDTYCKECVKERAYKWRSENPDKSLESFKKYNHSDKGRKRGRKYGKKVRENGQYRDWQRNNTDKTKGYADDRKQHKEHRISKEEWKNCKEFFDDSCAYCGITYDEHKQIYNEDLHKEHVDYEGANDLSNCVPGCKSCNSSKRIYSLEEWYTSDKEFYKAERLDRISEWLNDTYKLYIKPPKPKGKYTKKSEKWFKQTI